MNLGRSFLRRVPSSAKRGTKRPRESGKFDTIDPEIVKLGKWVKRQRRFYATGKLTPQRIEALKQINFDFNPGNATKEERLNIQLGLLDALRKRRELTNAQVVDLNYLYDEWKRRAELGITVPVHVEKSDEGKNKHNLKWMQKFEELKAFKLRTGHTRVRLLSTKDGGNASNRALAKWVDYQRQTYSKRKHTMSDERISLLESIGFEWRVRHVLPVGASIAKVTVATNTAKSPGDDLALSKPKTDDQCIPLSSIFEEPRPMENDKNVHDYNWMVKYEQLKRYKDLFGTTQVHCTQKQKTQSEFPLLQALEKWTDSQRKAYRKMKNGQKHGLSKSRINLLNKLDFDFSEPAGKTVEFRGWNEKLEKLKEYKLKHGDTRVPTRKKKGDNDPNYDAEMQSLAKWVEHQRGMYWKKARGEKTSLSDARILALNEIGFEWRLIGESRSSTSLSSGNNVCAAKTENLGGAIRNESRVGEHDNAPIVDVQDGSHDDEMREMSVAENIINAIDVPETDAVTGISYGNLHEV